MLYCNNKTGKTFHTHATIEEAAACWGTPALYAIGGTLPDLSSLTVTTLPGDWKPAPPPVPKPRWYDDPSSGSQWWRVEKEGGSKKRAKALSKGECSQYIDALKFGLAPKELDPPEDEPEPVYSPGHGGLVRPTSPAAPAPPTPPALPKRSSNFVHGHWVAKRETIVMTPLLEHVPDGRYALQMADEHPTFLRVSRPKGGKWAGCLKVQTQHSERYEDAWCLWPDGEVGVFKPSVEDYINLLISDHRGAARKYGRIQRRCACCGRELTDERSIHYSIGPECEKSWPWMITLVDEEEELRKAEG